MTWYKPGDRVQLRYKAPGKGDGCWVELPFVIGVFADFSGNANDNQFPIEDREFSYISLENFDEVLASFSPKLRVVSTDLKNNQPGDYQEIQFSRLADFLPEKLRTYNIPLETILNNPEFLQLEATWRGVSYLVRCMEPGKSTRIRLFDIGKVELGNALAEPNKLVPQNPLVRKSYVETFGQPGGEPFGCFIGDYYFDHSEEDAQILSAIAEFATLHLAPFIAGVTPGTLPLELADNEANVVKLHTVPQTNSWETLRTSVTSRFLGLTVPRVLIREPCHLDNAADHALTPSSQEGDSTSKPCWANAAFAMGANILRSFQNTGWLGNIRGIEAGGLIERTIELGPKPAKVTEMPFTDQIVHDLLIAGYMPLMQLTNSNECAFIGAHSVHRHAQHENLDHQADEFLASVLPQLLTVSRIAHYLKCLFRDQAELAEPDQVEALFKSWLASLIDLDGGGSAKRPIRKAAVSLSEFPGNPNLQKLSVAIEAYYRLGGMIGLLRLDTLLFADGKSLGKLQATLSVNDPVGVYYPEDDGEQTMRLVDGSRRPNPTIEHASAPGSNPVTAKTEKSRPIDPFVPDLHDPEWYGASSKRAAFFIFLVIVLWSWLGK